MKSQVAPESAVESDRLCCPPLTQAALSDGEATELATVLKALADPVRVRLISLVATAEDGELCACDLPEILGKSQPTISHHLRQLVDVGLLDREQRGKWAWFRLVPNRLAACCTALGGTALGGTALGGTALGDTAPRGTAPRDTTPGEGCC